jgi:lipopolysaccharide biosynthesis protein/glycosyltransferase involved in cell wall biosynthesis
MPRFARKRTKPSVITLADQARDQGQWERAAGYYREALQRRPQNPPIWVQFGHVLKEAGHWAEAERAYRTAMAQDPASADPHLHLGHILKIQGRKEEARTAYLRAVAIDPSLDGVSFEFSQLGWSEAHVSALKAMLQSDALHHPLLAPDGQRLDGVAAHSIIEDTGQQVVLAENQFEGRRDYAEWVRLYDTIDDDDRRAITAAVGDMTNRPLISVVMPVYNTPEAYLRAAIDSVRQQLYPNWELCIADDASTAPHVRSVIEHYRASDPRIKVCYRSENGHISAASNSALALATGGFIALLDHDDALPEYALYMVAATLNSDPEVDLIYSDEDKIDENGQRFDPHFKSDWNPDLMLSQNMFCHLGIYRRSLIEKIGGFRLGYEGSQDYDLILRAQSLTTPNRIHHIPHILYHWRAIPGSMALASEEKDYPVSRARQAIGDHLAERGITAQVLESRHPALHRVRYGLPAPAPRVTIVIPTRDQVDLLRQSVEGLLHRTDYPDLEIMIIENRSQEATTRAYYEQLTCDRRIRILSYDAPFNHSAINNFAVARATGSMICLLNSGIEPISREWLAEMVSHAVRKGIGAVGALICRPDDRVQQAGIVVGPERVAWYAHQGLHRGDFGYFARAAVIQNLSAVTAACLVMQKRVFHEVGGFNEKDLPTTLNDVDLCLRIREAGYRIVWTPYAELDHHAAGFNACDKEIAPHSENRVDSEIGYMLRRWGHVLHRDPYYNLNLSLNDGMFGLAFPPRIEKPWRRAKQAYLISHRSPERHSTIAMNLCSEPKDGQAVPSAFDRDWYVATYRDVAESGVDPLEHYIRYGAAEGRAPHSPLFRTFPAYTEKNIPDLFELRVLKPRGRIAVVLHLYYPELWNEMRRAIERITQPFDLFVTLVEGRSEQVKAQITAAFPNAYVVVLENRGRDIGPFLLLLQSGVLFRYDLVCKLHTKRSPHREDGDAWRHVLIDGVLGTSSQIDQIVTAFRADLDLGMVVADGNIFREYDNWAGNERLLAELLPRVGISTDVRGRSFPGGSIFWIRSFLLRTLAAVGLTPDDFEPEPTQVDGSLPHAVERMFGLICEDAGMRVAEVSELSKAAHRVSRGSPRVPIVAYYLPQFHPIPENDEWWGAGFTEWTNVTRAKPLFRGHRQPRLPSDLGFYDLRLAEAREAQANLARKYGLSAFCYYYYWFNGRRILERPLDEVLASGKPDYPFMICWANEPWTRNWDGENQHVLLSQTYEPGWATRFARDVARLLRDCRYFRLGNQPMLLIYRIAHIPEPGLAMREIRMTLRENGIPEVHLAAAWVRFTEDDELPADPSIVGLDAYFEFPPHMVAAQPLQSLPPGVPKGFDGSIFDYNRTVAATLAKLDEPVAGRRHRCVMAGFDNTARKPKSCHIYHGATATNFRRWLRGTILHEESQYGQRVVFINAWNEWAEGTYLEPDREFGCGWLEAVASAARVESDAQNHNFQPKPRQSQGPHLSAFGKETEA